MEKENIIMIYIWILHYKKFVGVIKEFVYLIIHMFKVFSLKFNFNGIH